MKVIALNTPVPTWRRILLPGGVFITVMALHFLWQGFFPENDPAQAGWVALPQERSWLKDYEENGSYWLGYAYALSAAFVAVAFRRWLTVRNVFSKNMALSGLTFSGLLLAAGCFLIGCCGSPMLVVWLNLFGAAFVPLAKPILAAITTLSITTAYIWLWRKTR